MLIKLMINQKKKTTRSDTVENSSRAIFGSLTLESYGIMYYKSGQILTWLSLRMDWGFLGCVRFKTTRNGWILWGSYGNIMICWLVVFRHPSEKYESIGMIRNPRYGKIKNGNQTTNQMNIEIVLTNYMKA